MNTLPLLDLNGIWHISYFIGDIFIILFFIFRKIKYPFPLSIKLLWSWLLSWCLYIVVFPKAHFGPYTPNFQSTAAQIFIEAILIPFAAIELYSIIEKLIPFLAFFATLCVWFSWPGLMHAPSLNMALAALCVSALVNSYDYKILKKLLVTFIVITALTHHGTTALVIIAAQIFAGVIKGKYGKRIFLSVLPVMGLSAYLFQQQPRFNSGERIQKWAEFMSFWAHDIKRMILGIGPGSFVWYSVMTHPYQTGFFLQLHCDYLEILWALGILGGVLSVWSLIDIVKRAWVRPLFLLQGLFGCLAFMLTYEPLEYFPTALLIAWYVMPLLVVKDVDLKFTGLVRAIKSNDRETSSVTTS